MLASQNARVNKRLSQKLSPRVLGLVLPGCVASACLLLCAAAAAEFATANQVASFCRGEGPDTKLLGLAEERLGRVRATQ